MPSALTHSNLGDLIKLFLKSYDSYNSNDLTLSTPSADSDTLGERARICLNLALHQCYDLVKDSKYLEAYPTTQFSSIADQDYIELSTEATLDDVESVLDTTNKLKLIRKTWRWYRLNFPDPENETGVPVYYIRRNERIYLAPRPSSAINYTVDFRKFTGDLKLNGDLCLLPTHYNYWVISEAKVKWAEMEDPNSVPAIFIEERNSNREIAIESIMSEYDLNLQAGSTTEREGLGILPYVRPVNG